MNGVSIINEYCCSSFEPTRTVAAYAVWIIGVVALFMMTRVVFSDAKERMRARCTVFAIFAAVFIFVALDSYKSYMDRWMEYDVIVSDSVSYNEFTSKYEVISENDGILRVIYK